MPVYSTLLPFVWAQLHFQTFIPACLSAAPASFLTVKSGSGEVTGPGMKKIKEEMDGKSKRFTEQLKEGRTSRATVATVMINKRALGALTERMPQWMCVQYLLPQSC